MSKFWKGTRTLALLAAAAMLTAPLAAAGDTLNKAELKKLIATASTPQDHERIANHFDAKAAELEAEAKEHAELAAAYRANPNIHESKHPGSPQTFAHCDSLARTTRAAAHDARQLAADHRALAKPAK